MSLHLDKRRPQKSSPLNATLRGLQTQALDAYSLFADSSPRGTEVSQAIAERAFNMDETA
jgi:hypothetical protein